MGRLFFILLFLPLLVSSQYSGTYCNGAGFSGYCITLLSKNNFKYSYSDCTSSSMGSGTYTLSRKNLILHFKQDTTISARIYIDSSLTPIKTPGICEVRLTLVDRVENEPIIFANILQKRDSPFPIKNFNEPLAMTDTDGFAVFQIPVKNIHQPLIVSYVGFKDVEIKLSQEADYKIKIYMDNDWPKIISDKTYKFKIKRKNGDFQLVTKKGEHFYKKTNGF